MEDDNFISQKDDNIISQDPDPYIAVFVAIAFVCGLLIGRFL